MTTWDVVIVGAGLAGASAAAVLSKKGVRVLLVDARETYPNCFKAEKIESDQAVVLRKFGLLEQLLPFASRIRKIVGARNKSVLKTCLVEQYGIFYHDMVNGVRNQLPASVTFEVARVQHIDPGPDISKVTLVGGKTIAARLVVIACGRGGPLLAGLGIRQRMIRKRHSFSIGFNIARDDGKPFPFDELTYYPDRFSTRVAYLTLFPIRDVMRANYFVYRMPDEDWVNQFRMNPDERLKKDLPKLVHFTGSFHVASRVEMCPIDLYRAEGHLQSGLVLLGDACQGACPTTGTGISKVLTDVDVLCNECVAEWLSTPGIGVEKIARYYCSPRKQACDAGSLKSAEYQRMFSMAPSLRWRLRRELSYLKTRLYGAIDLDG